MEESVALVAHKVRQTLNQSHLSLEVVLWTFSVSHGQAPLHCASPTYTLLDAVSS